MYKKSRHIIRLVTIQAALCLLFSISSFADGYSFQEDGDQHDQRFSGTNKIYTDGIYVGEMGVIDAYMDNGFNTYNGTNIIDATAYPGAGQDSDSTYNGTLDVTANDIISSKTTIDDATVNASTSVTVNDVLAENNLNAGVQFNNSNFNNDVTLSGSGAVNLEGSTVNNLVLGNIPQMSSLIKAVAILMDNISNPIIQSSSTRSFTFDGTSYSYSLKRYRIDSTYNYYCNTTGYFLMLLFNLKEQLCTWYNVSASESDPSYKVYVYEGVPILVYKNAFAIYSYDSQNDVINRTYEYRYSHFYTTLYNYFQRTIASYIDAHVAYLADTWYRWYNPNISLANSKFWKAYNTDTGNYDDVNLSTVFAYITWYLGQLYNDGTNITQNMEDMTDNINTAATTFQDMEQKEQAAITQIQSGFESFLPDVNQFSSFKAITWCSNYLQQIYLSLGSYGTVIFIALLFGVCLQFIGYFRYK